MTLDSSMLTPLQRELATAFGSKSPKSFLTGGAVLVGWVLRHRTTDDLDWFTDDEIAAQAAKAALDVAAADVGGEVETLMASPDFRRALVRRGVESVKVDLVFDRAPQLFPKVVRDGIRMDSVEEIFVNKICALVGRSEIRDAVDLLALERHGLRVEDYIVGASSKDGGVTPATLAWLIGTLHIPEHLPGGGDVPELKAFLAQLEGRLLAMVHP